MKKFGFSPYLSSAELQLIQNTETEEHQQESPYFTCIVRACLEFLDEEIKGFVSTELRFQNKIKAARTLFAKEWQAMGKPQR